MQSSIESDSLTVVGSLEYSLPTSQSTNRSVIYLETSAVIGRSVDCDISFGDPTISSKHLQIYAIAYDKADTLVKPLIYAEDLSSNGSYWNGLYMGKGNGGYLLDNGDELRLSPRVSLTFRTNMDSTNDDVLCGYQRMETEYFQNLYRISNRRLGTGAQGEVCMAINLTQGHQLACKIINLRQIRETGTMSLKRFMATRDRSNDNQNTARALKQVSKTRIKRSIKDSISKVAREFEILKDLNHPNIIRLEKVYRTDDTVYIFEELVTGGDLISFIEHKGGKLEEAEAALITRQVLEAVNHLHARDIVHRDLKPENILVASLAQGARIVLTDFGNAMRLTTAQGKGPMRMSTVAGTAGYAAPEINGHNRIVKEKGYTKAVDMWSLGCVATALLTGDTPFSCLSSTDREEKRNASDVAEKSHSFVNKISGPHASLEWQEASERSKDFIRKLLVLDEKTRMTAEQALRHHWLSNSHVKKMFDAMYRKSIAGWKGQPLSTDVIEGIPGYYNPPKSSFKKPKPKHARPIEPHFHPYHRRIEQLLTPRPRLSSPSIDELTNKWQQDIPSKASGDYASGSIKEQESQKPDSSARSSASGIHDAVDPPTSGLPNCSPPACVAARESKPTGKAPKLQWPPLSLPRKPPDIRLVATKQNHGCKNSTRTEKSSVDPERLDKTAIEQLDKSLSDPKFAAINQFVNNGSYTNCL